MDCAKCNRDLGSPRKTVKCIECGLCYHPYCTRLKTVENYRKLKTELKASWRCDPCCHASRVTKQLAGRAEVIDEVDEVEPSDDDQDLVETSKNMDMEGKIDLLLSSFNKQMKSMKRSMQFFNENFESTQKILKELKNEVTENRKEVDQLVRKNKNLERKVTYLDMKLNDVEQRDLRNDIQISGIPETTGEDVHEIVRSLMQGAGLQKTPEVEIVDAFRVGKVDKKGKKKRNIIVKFSELEPKTEMIQWSRRGKGIELSSVDTRFPKDTMAYISERLTGYNRYLFAITKAFAKEYSHKFVWVKDGKIYMRKDEQSVAKRITMKEQIMKMDISGKINWREEEDIE
ncbi:hypothetical protein GE061_002278 [Apolygus lucorum]|uniref:FP protein C-terminal domain-containing protein n=1 Tax=Apolygus lucorum TaxID=248454 RepID=A0A8S9X4A0_APOLU|nr:hypothetical protein GE061_002278 [Apolygus lucorum]